MKLLYRNPCCNEVHYKFKGLPCTSLLNITLICLHISQESSARLFILNIKPYLKFLDGVLCPSITQFTE